MSADLEAAALNTPHQRVDRIGRNLLRLSASERRADEPMSTKKARYCVLIAILALTGAGLMTPQSFLPQISARMCRNPSMAAGSDALGMTAILDRFTLSGTIRDRPVSCLAGRTP
jgi:hypothetical protein